MKENTRADVYKSPEFKRQIILCNIGHNPSSAHARRPQPKTVLQLFNNVCPFAGDRWLILLRLYTGIYNIIMAEANPACSEHQGVGFCHYEVMSDNKREFETMNRHSLTCAPYFVHRDYFVIGQLSLADAPRRRQVRRIDPSIGTIHCPTTSFIVGSLLEVADDVVWVLHTLFSR